MYNLSGKFGKAVAFDGSNDYVSIGTSSSLNPTNAMTIAAWLYIAGSQGTYREAIGRWDTVGGVNERTYVLGINASNHLRFGTSRDGTDATAVYSGDTATASLNTWYFVVGV